LQVDISVVLKKEGRPAHLGNMWMSFYSAVPWIILTILCMRCSHRNQQCRRTISSGSAFMIDNSLYV